jgi:hypothetical protein
MREGPRELKGTTNLEQTESLVGPCTNQRLRSQQVERPNSLVNTAAPASKLAGTVEIVWLLVHSEPTMRVRSLAKASHQPLREGPRLGPGVHLHHGLGQWIAVALKKV